MDKNINLPGRTDAQGAINDLRNVGKLADICLTECGLGTVGLDRLHNFRRTLTAALGHVVDNHIGPALSKEFGNACTKPSVVILRLANRVAMILAVRFQSIPRSSSDDGNFAFKAQSLKVYHG